MGNLRACFVVAILGACSGGSDKPDAAIKIPDAAVDAKVFMDAPPVMFDLSCVGSPAPTMAAAAIGLSGTAQLADFNGSMPSATPIADATVKACKAQGASCATTNLLGTDTTDSGGNFVIPQIANTSMAPVDAYLLMTKTGVRTTMVYPSAPFLSDQGNIPVLALSPTILQVLGFLGCNQDDAANGLIAVALTDCADKPLSDTANVTIGVKQGGTAVTGATVVDLSQLSQQAAGTFAICNVPPAATTISVSYKSTMFREPIVKTAAGATTATIVRPGY